MMGDKGQKRNRSTTKEQDSKGLFYGLRIKIIGGVCIPLIVVLSLVGIVMTNDIVQVVESLKATDIQSQTTAASNETQNYFEPFFLSAEIVADMDGVEQLFETVEQQTEAYKQYLSAPIRPQQPEEGSAGTAEEPGEGSAETAEEPEESVPPQPFDLAKYEHLDAIHKELEDAYNNHETGVMTMFLAVEESSQVIQSDGNITDSSFVLTDRPWYQMVKQSSGKPIISSVYTDVVTGKQVVTVAVGILNDSGEVVGASGMDIALDQLQSALADIEIGATGYVTVYDSAQNIVYHPDSSLTLTNMKSVDYSTDFLNLLQSKQNADVMEYQRSGSTFYGATIYLKELDWQVIGCMPSEEFEQEAVSVGAKLGLGFAGCALILGVICILLAGTIVKPVKKTHKRNT